jgi:hypothetical protein
VIYSSYNEISGGCKVGSQTDSKVVLENKEGRLALDFIVVRW